jgi:FlaA1/EpsC-like NDP-sugar epimerase
LGSLSVAFQPQNAPFLRLADFDNVTIVIVTSIYPDLMPELRIIKEKPHIPLGERFWFLRRPVQFVADVAILCAAFLIAYLPAVNIQLGDFYRERALTQVSFVVFVQFSALFLLGAYSIIWRYISITDVKVFLLAAAVSGGILVSVRFLLSFTAFDLWQVPISVIVIDTVLAFGGLLALRVLRRFIYELSEHGNLGHARKVAERIPALLVGAGRTGATLAREVAGRKDAELDVRGFVDDDPRKKGGSVSSFKVLGHTSDLARFVDEIGIKRVVITLDNATGKEIRRIIDICGEIPVKTQIVPSLNELAQGRVSISRIRDVQIEDLLGRDPVTLEDANLSELLSGRTIMVTGAGGSIGSELVRQIIRFSPARILLVERAEFFLFEIHRELSEVVSQVEMVPLIADVGDGSRIRQIFENYRPEVIFHAAAHKHVPLMESNAIEAVKNNIFATQTIGKLAGEFGATHFVLISTDKAVNPTSIMGASKRMAEIVVQELNQTSSTNYIAVRFGNVLGSAGSVVPIFRDQIQKGGPVTVTDPEMTRYFMTIPEASQLVLQAGALGSGGEIFILDMGRPVKILDLAEDMIRLSGLTPHEDIDIVFNGVRKGEKLFEELEISGENLEKTRHPKVYIGKIATFSKTDVAQMLSAFQKAVNDNDGAHVRTLFNQFLSEANVSEDESTDQQMTEPVKEKFFTQPSKLGLAEK